MATMKKRNPAYGCWSEEETNWSEKDTAFIERTTKDQEPVPTSLKEIIATHESLGY